MSNLIVSCKSSFFLVLVASVTVSACGQSAEDGGGATPTAQETADVILHNGNVFSLSWGEPNAEGVPAADAPYIDGQWSPDAEAIAIKDGNILLVGRRDEVMQLAGDSTELIDAGGGYVYPGFADAHSHIRGLVSDRKYVSLTGAADEAEAIERIVAATESRVLQPGEWIVGGGWDEGEWMDQLPTERQLSELFPDNPVLMLGETGFGVWGNQAALEAAGLDRNTKDPVKGRFTRYENGELSGVGLDDAGRAWRAVLPPETVEERKESMLEAMNIMASDGFTMTHDAGTGSLSMAAYEQLSAEDNMPIRIYAMVDRADAALREEWAERGPMTFPGNMLFVRSMKSGLDGTLGVRSARFLDEYSDAPGHTGLDEDWSAQIGQMDAMIRAGFQINTHAIGDKANREILEFLERHFAENPALKDLRHRSEHASVIHPDDYERFADLNLIASVQPPYVAEDPPWAITRIGDERAKDMYAWRKMRRYGIHLAFGSDLDSYDHNVFYGIYAAIARADKNGDPEDGFLPDEALTSEEAIRGYTNWAAYAALLENETGKLEEGYWADIAVVDTDILNVGNTAPMQLLDGDVLMTIVGGKVVYRR